MRLQPEQPAPSFEVGSLDGSHLRLEQFAGRPLLLMFHRYAGCPMCNIRLHRFAESFPALHERGLEAIAFFHSPAEEILKHAGGRKYPFAIATDPRFRVYRKYGVEASWPRLALSFFSPRVYRDLFAALRNGFSGGRPTRRLATMPADFFVRPDGKLQAVHYGNSIAEHLTDREIEAALEQTR